MASACLYSDMLRRLIVEQSGQRAWPWEPGGQEESGHRVRKKEHSCPHPRWWR